jgi:hypothetical protein
MKENVMRKLCFGSLAVLVLSALVQAGGDPWKTKPFEKWTESDVAAVLQISPWSKPGVQASGAWRPDGMTQANGGPTIPGSGGSAKPGARGGGDQSHVSAGSTPDTPGGLEKSLAAEAARQPYSIFWWSSRTVRAASFRRAVLKGTMTEADAEEAVGVTPDEYMVLVQATDMRIFQQRSEKAFESAAYLQTTRARAKILPSRVAFLKGPDGQTVTGAIFYFPKKDASGEPTIRPDEKEVDFYLQVGDAKVRTYFEPKKMVDSQGEDL